MPVDTSDGAIANGNHKVSAEVLNAEASELAGTESNLGMTPPLALSSVGNGEETTEQLASPSALCNGEGSVDVLKLSPPSSACVASSVNDPADESVVDAGAASSSSSVAAGKPGQESESPDTVASKFKEVSIYKPAVSTPTVENGALEEIVVVMPPSAGVNAQRLVIPLPVSVDGVSSSVAVSPSILNQVPMLEAVSVDAIATAGELNHSVRPLLARAEGLSAEGSSTEENDPLKLWIEQKLTSLPPGLEAKIRKKFKGPAAGYCKRDFWIRPFSLFVNVSFGVYCAWYYFPLIKKCLESWFGCNTQLSPVNSTKLMLPNETAGQDLRHRQCDPMELHLPDVKCNPQQSVAIYFFTSCGYFINAVQSIRIYYELMVTERSKGCPQGLRGRSFKAIRYLFYLLIALCSVTPTLFGDSNLWIAASQAASNVPLNFFGIDHFVGWASVYFSRLFCCKPKEINFGEELRRAWQKIVDCNNSEVYKQFADIVSCYDENNDVKEFLRKVFLLADSIPDKSHNSNYCVFYSKRCAIISTSFIIGMLPQIGWAFSSYMAVYVLIKNPVAAAVSSAITLAVVEGFSFEALVGSLKGRHCKSLPQVYCPKFSSVTELLAMSAAVCSGFGLKTVIDDTLGNPCSPFSLQSKELAIILSYLGVFADLFQNFPFVVSVKKAIFCWYIANFGSTKYRKIAQWGFKIKEVCLILESIKRVPSSVEVSTRSVAVSTGSRCPRLFSQVSRVMGSSCCLGSVAGSRHAEPLLPH